ncbi:MAG: hypothetical protein GY946_20560, partial [bacterium]|nr:hypothetical protein [bacterium]
MNDPIALPRASHVNTGTSVPHEERPWPDHEGTVLRHRKLPAEVDERPDVTMLGGLMLPLASIRRFKVAEKFDERVKVLKIHLPYHESDHVLSQALMLYGGGTCLEDMAMLQQDDPFLKMVDAERTPDPTTAGDFLRRFGTSQLMDLRGVIDDVQEEVWNDLQRRRRWTWSRRRRKQGLCILHLDGKVKEVYGAKKEGADFTYNARWALQVLVASLDDGECVGVRLGSGAERSSDRAAELLWSVLPRLVREYEDVLVLADSDFDRKDVREPCDAYGAYYAFVAREYEDRSQLAESIEIWRSFRTRAQLRRDEISDAEGYEPRAKKRNRRRGAARRRGYTDLQLRRQWVAERPWVHAREEHTDRMVFRKQLIDEETGPWKQRELWERWRYRYIITNLPESWSTASCPTSRTTRSGRHPAARSGQRYCTIFDQDRQMSASPEDTDRRSSYPRTAQRSAVLIVLRTHERTTGRPPISPGNLRGVAMVEAKHATKALSASNGSVAIGRGGRLEQPVPETLMRAFFVIMADEHLNAVPQVPLPERDDLR